MSSLYPEAYLLDYTYHFLVSWQKLCLLAVAQMLLLLGVVSRSPDACVRDDAKSVGSRAVLNIMLNSSFQFLFHSPYTTLI